MAAKNDTLAVPVSERALIDALHYVMQQDEYAIKGVCNETQEALFTGTKTGDSPGRVFYASVVPDPGRVGSVLQLGVGTAPGTMPSFSSSKKNQAALDLLIEKVQAALASPDSSRPEPIESHAVQWDGTVVPWTGGDFPED